MTIKLTKAEATALTELTTALDQAKSGLLEYVGSIRATWQSEFDSTAKHWQEGVAGVQAQEHLDAIELLYDAVEEIDIALDIIEALS